MKQSPRTSNLIYGIDFIAIMILVLVPFHASLTVWFSSVVGHYTILRLWKEILLVPLVSGAGYLVWKDRALRTELRASWLLRLMAVYAILTIVLGLFAFADHQVNKTALGYALIDNLRILVFFWVCFVIGSKSDRIKRNWQKILLIPAVIVISFGLIQHFALPTDWLRHLGYSTKTIVPYQTVDNNNLFVRLQSTLRGPNPLGAYLVIIASASSVLIISLRNFAKRLALAVFGLAAAIVLFFSYSRSGWFGSVVGSGLGAWLSIVRRSVRITLGLVGVVLVIVASVFYLGFRHSVAFEDTFLHTSTQTHSSVSSNHNHETAVLMGLKDIYHKPFGLGPGTAGPASIHNNHPPRVAENYFVQLGQEVGVIGAGLFIAINVLLLQKLWLKRADPLVLTLFSSLIGLIIVNLLSHAWTDDTLAYLWWGLAGVALAPTRPKTINHKLTN